MNLKYFWGFRNLFCELLQYLGVVVDNKLCFKQHIDHFCKKLARLKGVFLAGNVFSRTFLFRFYQIYAKPFISYGILVYGCASKTSLIKILSNQKRILRTIALGSNLVTLRKSF